MNAPSEAADAQRMMATMQNERISCFTCRHMEGYTHDRPWCDKFRNEPPGDIFQIAATCQYFLWDISQ